MGRASTYQTNANHQPSPWCWQKKDFCLMSTGKDKWVVSSSFHFIPKTAGRKLPKTQVFEEKNCSKIRLQHDWHLGGLNSLFLNNQSILRSYFIWHILNIDGIKNIGESFNLYLNCAKVHIFIVEVSALCQFWEVALGEGKSKDITHTQIHSLVSFSASVLGDTLECRWLLQTEGVEGGGTQK